MCLRVIRVNIRSWDSVCTYRASGLLALGFITLLLKACYSWYLLAPRWTKGGLDDLSSGVSLGKLLLVCLVRDLAVRSGEEVFINGDLSLGDSRELKRVLAALRCSHAK